MPTSSSISPALREFAQIPDRYTQLSPDVERYVDDRVGVIQGTVWAGVFGVRVEANEVESLLEEVRARIPPDKDVAWWIDEGAQPYDLRERLIELGLTVPQSGHTIHSLAFEGEPSPARDDVEVARVETFAEFVEANEIMWDVFETPAPQRDKQRGLLREEFDAQMSSGVPGTFLARVDGTPAGVGRSVYSDRGVFLIAGSVVPSARGRGVYRALVRARWEDAVARGTPGLVTEALPDTSYPILTRIGFQDVGVIRRLKDTRS